MSLMAYIDAGTGSLLLQAMLAAFVAVSLFFGRIKAFFKKKNKKTTEDQSK